MKAMRLGGSLALLLCLSGCGVPGAGGVDKEGNVSAFCDTLGAGSSQTLSNVDPGCVDCSVTDAGKAADDDARSFATISDPLSADGPGALILSIAQTGVIYGAGRQVGAFLTFPNDYSGINVAHVVTIRTYAGGFLQEEASTGANISAGRALQRIDIRGDSSLPREFVYFTTSKPFDAVEIHADSRGARWGSPATYQVYGLCSNGGVSGN